MLKYILVLAVICMGSCIVSKTPKVDKMLNECVEFCNDKEVNIKVFEYRKLYLKLSAKCKCMNGDNKQITADPDSIKESHEKLH